MVDSMDKPIERLTATIERDGRKYTIAPRIDGPKVHDIKCAAGYFEQVKLGNKTAELRYNDRDYAPHDILRLHELEYGKLTGQTLERLITHIVWDINGPWLQPGYCMLSLRPIQ
jgi:hypothetical protein